MKKFILLLIVAAIAFAVWNRQRLYLRDPFATVLRDGAKEPGAQVLINYSNDVLLQNYNAPMYVTLIQHGQPTGTPATLRCIAYTLCMTDANPATLVDGDQHSPAHSMSSSAVDFTDTKGLSEFNSTKGKAANRSRHATQVSAMRGQLRSRTTPTRATPSRKRGRW